RVVAIGCAVAAAMLLLIAAVLLAPRQPPAVAASIVAPQPPPPSPLPEPPPVTEPTTPVPIAGFSQAVAWRALYSTSGEVAHCRRRNVWGGTTATVTFANDGTVTGVAFRRPFRGSQTAICVVNVLESVHLAPFTGNAGAVNFWFYVQPKASGER
ncbi:MAG TPA: hypothetical protein VGY54_26430, partial [Polyangiaceae bacterium]|nr:hypothetical protein [Polyangiaceae bacterium]